MEVCEEKEKNTKMTKNARKKRQAGRKGRKVMNQFWRRACSVANHGRLVR
jgi:hypothetical protein